MFWNFAIGIEVNHKNSVMTVNIPTETRTKYNEDARSALCVDCELRTALSSTPYEAHKNEVLGVPSVHLFATFISDALKSIKWNSGP
jgi:hypothetical protein